MTDQPASLTPTPDGYTDWLRGLKTLTHSAQQRAALMVNRELVLLFKLKNPAGRQWSIAKTIEHNWSRHVLVMQIENELGGLD